ncbi:MAG: type VI secretion system baseplate subunit TssE [bacterium]
MPRVPPQDRLQPSLLDRLTDEDPSQKSEAPEHRVLSMEALRQCVLRDLGWLFNTGDLDAIENLKDYPLVAESTLNYGIAHLAGTQKSSIEARDIERRLRQALVRFEPRILRDTVKVEFLVGEHGPSYNAITCYIEGMLWADPVPLHIFLKTEADLEMGTFAITEQAGREEN